MTGPDLTELTADCANCFGLCCVAPAFAASSDFAIDKPAGRACPNLGADSRCGIHSRLRESGFPGCVVYDCLGAGQKLSRITFEGRDWRDDPERAGVMFQLLPVMRQLHELLRYLIEAGGLSSGRLRAELARSVEQTRAMTRRTPSELLQLDVAAHRGRVNPLLRQASQVARAGHLGPDHSGADLVGARWRRADLRGAGLRGTRLVGADLREADLRRADLTGADLRGADLRGADLTGALFMTAAQLEAARGDAATRRPRGLAAPAHWPTPV